MSTIDYPTFKANVQKGHLSLLQSFTSGIRVRVLDTDVTQQATIRQQCLDLYTNELLDRVAEGYERVNGETWRTFDGYVNASATGYVAKLAEDLVDLRDAS